MGMRLNVQLVKGLPALLVFVPYTYMRTAGGRRRGGSEGRQKVQGYKVTYHGPVLCNYATILV
jgi:hypothetical protein